MTALHATRPQPRLRPAGETNGGAYWPVLGLVDGPGLVLGVGLVVAGVSVPVPPTLEPPLDAPPELLGELMPPEVPEVPEDPLLPLLPDTPALPGVLELPVPGLAAPPDIPEVPELPDDIPEVPPPLVPELPLLPEPEPPPVMPVHAPNSAVQTIANIHLVI